MALIMGCPATVKDHRILELRLQRGLPSVAGIMKFAVFRRRAQLLWSSGRGAGASRSAGVTGVGMVCTPIYNPYKPETGAGARNPRYALLQQKIIDQELAMLSARPLGVQHARRRRYFTAASVYADGSSEPQAKLG